jgi:MSHA pilin protein MshC
VARAGNATPYARRCGRPRGFTVVELVVAISIAGLLAAIIVPRFVGRDAFESRGFHDQAIATVRFAQKTAIAWRRPIFVCVSATSIAVGTAAGCAPPIEHPVPGKELVVNAPGGVTLTGPSFSFDPGGRPIPNSQATIAFNSTIAGDPARQIVVEAETGYVHP